MTYAFLNERNTAIGSDGWTADNDRLIEYVGTGLWKNGSVVAVLVGGYDEELIENGNAIVTACNAHDRLTVALVTALEALENSDPVRSANYADCARHRIAKQTVREALAAVGVTP